MKNIMILFSLLISITITSCGQEKYDFAELKSQEDISELLLKIQKDNNDVEIDTVFTFNEITVEGMHYAGVPIKTAILTNTYVQLTTDTIHFSAKKLLEALETKKGLTKLSGNYSGDNKFEWNAETEDNLLNINLVNGKHLAAFGDKDYAELTTTYKPIYDIPIANIHKKIKTYENQPKYELQIIAYECVYDVMINDITLALSSTDYEFNLNNLITSEVSSVKIIVKPKSNKEGKPSVRFNDEAYFSATIVDIDTKEPLKEIDRMQLIGSGPIEIKLDFNSNLPYYPEAWTEGADLRNDKNLNKKIIALYDKLGKAYLKKEEKTINDMLYQKDFEMQQLAFDSHYETAKKEWEVHLEIQKSTYKYTVAEEFDIEFNDNGKLIYVYPKNKTDMLILTGKEYDNSANYYLYQPKGSNELKIIR